jgi:hypothetical protein
MACFKVEKSGKLYCIDTQFHLFLKTPWNQPEPVSRASAETASCGKYRVVTGSQDHRITGSISFPWSINGES